MLYRFRVDVNAFSFDDWPAMRHAFFKDEGDFKLVVYEIAKETKKPHYQGVVHCVTPKPTLESRIKKHKTAGAPRGCYSLTAQKPRDVDGYYNYLCKGDEYESLPEVLQSVFTDDEIQERHQYYHKRVQDTSALDKTILDLVLKKEESIAYYLKHKQTKSTDDFTPQANALWVSIMKASIDFLLDTSPKGFILSQVQRLAFCSLSRVLKNKDVSPDAIVRWIPEMLATKAAASMI